ncbi:MAG: toll/interleukin-1 receptor domain-containing protein [Gammaproteobacteria bacterium]
MTKVFISYCHEQGQWVWDRLVPCLKAGGPEVLIDRERFEAGKGVVGQMDAMQDQAHKHLLVLSEEYLKSSYCRHEMNRAIKVDPKFERGVAIPVMRGTCTLPNKIKKPNPLYVDLRKDKEADPWTLLFNQCNADLGTTAPSWLTARDEIVRFLKRKQSVSLVVKSNAAWRGLVEQIGSDHLPALATVDLEGPGTASRQGLLTEILKALGNRVSLPDEPKDLVEFGRVFESQPGVSYLALTHFDMVPHRPNYDVDLLAGLKYLIMDSRKLVLLAQSRTPFANLLPRGHPLSEIDIKTVELR